jgi:formiminotetrahydrofolate cyclodeaminase
VTARRLPKETDRDREARRVQLNAAVREATRTPLSIASRASEVLALAEELAPIGNRNAVSDVGVAGLLAGAAIRGAAMNVEINLPSLPDDEPLRGEARRELDELLAGMAERERALAAAIGDRIG